MSNGAAPGFDPMDLVPADAFKPDGDEAQANGDVSPLSPISFRL